MEIKIDGQEIDVVDRSIVLELVNPMVGFADVPGAKAYDIKVKDTDLTKRVLGNIQHPLVRADSKLLPTELTRGKVTIEKGVSVVRPSNDGFSLGFTSNYAELFGAAQSKTLREIDFGVLPFGSAEINASLANTYLINGWVLPTVKNAKFYENGNVPGGWTGKVNDFDSGSFTGGEKTPMFFVKYVLKSLADSAGVTFKGVFWESDLMNKLLFYTNQVAAGTIEVRKHLPNLTVGAVLLGLRKAFNMVIRIDAPNRSIRLDFGRDLLKEVPNKNWNDRIKRLRSGTPTWSEGLRLRFSADGNDGFSKDAFYLPYESAPSGKDLGFNVIESVFSSTLMDGAIPWADQAGNTAGQEDKDCSPRLLYWIGGATPAASNSYGGVAFSAIDHAAEYWQEQEVFFKAGFMVDENMVLSSMDIADVSARFRGERAEAPIYYASGVNWLVQSLTVPGEDNGRCKVRLLRI